MAPMKKKFPKQHKPRRMTFIKVQGRADAPFHDDKVMYEERQERRIQRVSSVVPKLSELASDHEARLYRRYKS